VATTDQLASRQRECRKGYVDPSLIDYAVRLVAATRAPENTAARSFRSTSRSAQVARHIHLIEAARALALLRGRD